MVYTCQKPVLVRLSVCHSAEWLGSEFLGHFVACLVLIVEPLREALRSAHQSSLFWARWHILPLRFVHLHLLVGISGFLSLQRAQSLILRERAAEQTRWAEGPVSEAPSFQADPFFLPHSRYTAVVELTSGS